MTVDDKERRNTNKAIIEAVMARITAGEFERLADYVSEDLVFELPYGPDFMPDRFEGRQTWNDMQLMTFKMFTSFRQEILEIHECLDPDELIAEYRSDAVVARNGNSYQNRYIGVFRFDHGKIVAWREFHNPEATKVL
jgi:ketosteroid isomerase-like protein